MLVGSGLCFVFDVRCYIIYYIIIYYIIIYTYTYTYTIIIIYYIIHYYYYILSYTILFSSSVLLFPSFPILSSSSSFPFPISSPISPPLPHQSSPPHPNIHSIRVGTYIYLFILFFSFLLPSYHSSYNPLIHSIPVES